MRSFQLQITYYITPLPDCMSFFFRSLTLLIHSIPSIFVRAWLNGIGLFTLLTSASPFSFPTTSKTLLSYLRLFLFFIDKLRHCINSLKTCLFLNPQLNRSWCLPPFLQGNKQLLQLQWLFLLNIRTLVRVYFTQLVFLAVSHILDSTLLNTYKVWLI